MRTLFTLLLAVMAVVSAPAQNKVVKKNIQVTSFSAIDASGGWDVIIRQGDRQSVSIEVSEAIYERAVVEVKNGTLRIYSKGNRSFSLNNFRISRNNVQKAYVTVTDLEKIDASGGVDVRFETPLKTGDFEVDLSGGTDLENLMLDCSRFKGVFSGGCDAEIQFVAVQEVKVDASGGSDVKLTGKTEELTLKASGGCDVSASKLVAWNCNATFSGAADGSIHVTNRLDVSVSGSADVVCYGSPSDVNKNVHKSSSLKFK